MTRKLAALFLVCVCAPLPGWAQSPDAPPVVGCAAPDGEPAPAERLYGRAEYLTWWLREGHVPPLLTTGTTGRGVLGQSDTRVLYGDDTLETRHQDRFVGTRLTLGWWLDDEHSLALEGSAFFLERDSTYFKATSGGETLLARPYVNADGTPGSEVIAGPTPDGTLRGGFNGYSRIELFGEEVNARVPLLGPGCWSLDLLAGAHFLQMRDRLDLTAVSYLLPDQSTLLGETDHFRADNRFYGGQLGLRGGWCGGRWSVSVSGEAALGGTEQEVRTFGDRTFATPLIHTVQPFGLLVQPGNRGTVHHVAFDVVSEVGVSVGCRLTSHLRLVAGYTFLGWANPVRAGDQAELVINPARPVPFREEFFWAQGVSGGLEVGW